MTFVQEKKNIINVVVVVLLLYIFICTLDSDTCTAVQPVNVRVIKPQHK